MPRPIPDDVENVTGFIWYLIPMPDDPVFVQAAWDAFSELTKPWNWGKEGRVPESDIAAQLWSDAIYEALRVRDMGFPDLLLDYLDEVEPLLRQLAQSDFCCDALPGADTIYTDLPSGLETSDTDTDTSTFPDGIADQSEWDDYICRAATAFVDSFIEIPDQVTGAISATIQVLTLIVIVYTTGAYIAIAGAIAGVLTVAGILDALGYLEDIIAGLNAETEDTPSEVQTELLAVRDDLICSIVDSPTNTAAGSAFRGIVANAVTSVAWENLLLLLSADSWFAKIYNHDAETAPDAECDCPGFTFTFKHDIDQDIISQPSFDGWAQSGVTISQYGSVCGQMWQYAMYEDDDTMHIHVGSSATAAGYTLPASFDAYLLRLEFDVCSGFAGELDLEVRYLDLTTYQDTISASADEPTTVVINPPNAATKPVRLASTPASSKAIQIFERSGSGGLGINGIRLYWDIVET